MTPNDDDDDSDIVKSQVSALRPGVHLELNVRLCPALLPDGPSPPREGQGPQLSPGAAHLAEGSSGPLKASDLQPFLEEVQGVRKGLADDSGSAATEQVFEVF